MVILRLSPRNFGRLDLEGSHRALSRSGTSARHDMLMIIGNCNTCQGRMESTLLAYPDITLLLSTHVYVYDTLVVISHYHSSRKRVVGSTFRSEIMQHPSDIRLAEYVC